MTETFRMLLVTSEEYNQVTYITPITLLGTRVSHTVQTVSTGDITKTCLYNYDPFKPHFCIVKLGLIGVYILFFFALKHRLWVLVRNASPRRF